MNKRISLFAFLFILCLAVRCQTRNVRHYTINEGLANNAVYSISQDMKGRMWFGTIDGVLINITNYITDNKNIIFDIRNISNKLITDLIFI